MDNENITTTEETTSTETPATEPTTPTEPISLISPAPTFNLSDYFLGSTPPSFIDNILPTFTTDYTTIPMYDHSFTADSSSTSSITHTWTDSDGVVHTSGSETHTHTTIDSDGNLTETSTNTTITGTDVNVVTSTYTDTVDVSAFIRESQTPFSTFADIFNTYHSLQVDPQSYTIGGRTNEFATSFGSKNSTEYSSSNFFDAGDRTGYLADFLNTSGVINLMGNGLSSLIRHNDYINFDMDNGNSFQAPTSNSSDDIFQISLDGNGVSYAKIGYQDAENTITYEDGVSYYNGGRFGDTLRVVENLPRAIHLNGDLGTIFNNITQIDATDSTSDNELFGSDADNVIRAGSGNDLLWGRAGNDKLYGGAGINTFFYGVNEGDDTIYDSSASDTVNLYNISLGDIMSAGEIGDNLLINMVNGGSLRIVGANGASNFMLGDQSAYNYNRSTHTWTQTATAPTTSTDTTSTEE